jgi:hypothetical protein
MLIYILHLINTMNKLFGTKKKEPPKPKVPTLQETSKTVPIYI